jgi:DNA polymerase-3 subunit beta
MKFIAYSQDLLRAVTRAERSTGKSLQLPIVSYLLLAAEKNKLVVSATDLEQGIHVSVIGKSEEGGSIAVPARMVLDFMRSVQDEKVSLVTSGTMLTITGTGRRATIQGLSGDDFPVIPKMKEQFLFEISSEVLEMALRAVIIAASRSEFRPELSGVSIVWSPNTDSPLTLAATDSFRLAEFRISDRDVMSLTRDGAVSCILPFKAAQEAIRIAGETGGSLRVAIDESQIGFRWDDTDFVSRLLEGTFPSYQSIIPRTFATEIRAARRQLISLLRQAGFFASKINDVKIHVHPNDRLISVSSRDPAKGEYEGKLECRIEGNEVELTFNYQFFLDGFEQIPDDEVTIGINEPHAPVLMQGSTNERFRYVVMPLRS